MSDPRTNHLNPGTGLILRRMGRDDIDSVMEIAASLPTAPQWARSSYEVVVSSDSQPLRVALVALYVDKVIGFAVSHLVMREAELETIGIERPAQGYGFGSSLLFAMSEELKLAGADEILLEVRASNEQARWFYGKAGFVEAGRRRGYYADPVEDALLLRLTLRK
jgi:[ribosomal protein S18]-alanine N-acetyltransferase